mmetsp:Transcript_42703/g.47736  ORF Transcript_42703/g.47736 Transcript_42703/m.47736 type:complete len:110 (+) Transcript_42703:1177-1506(+)
MDVVVATKRELHCTPPTDSFVDDKIVSSSSSSYNGVSESWVDGDLCFWSWNNGDDRGGINEGVYHGRSNINISITANTNTITVIDNHHYHYCSHCLKDMVVVMVVIVVV